MAGLMCNADLQPLHQRSYATTSRLYQGRQRDAQGRQSDAQGRQKDAQGYLKTPTQPTKPPFLPFERLPERSLGAEQRIRQVYKQPQQPLPPSHRRFQYANSKVTYAIVYAGLTHSHSRRLDVHILAQGDRSVRRDHQWTTNGRRVPAISTVQDVQCKSSQKTPSTITLSGHV